VVDTVLTCPEHGPAVATAPPEAVAAQLQQRLARATARAAAEVQPPAGAVDRLLPPDPDPLTGARPPPDAGTVQWRLLAEPAVAALTARLAAAELPPVPALDELRRRWRAGQPPPGSSAAASATASAAPSPSISPPMPPPSPPLLLLSQAPPGAAPAPVRKAARATSSPRLPVASLERAPDGRASAAPARVPSDDEDEDSDMVAVPPLRQAPAPVAAAPVRPAAAAGPVRPATATTTSSRPGAASAPPPAAPVRRRGF